MHRSGGREHGGGRRKKGSSFIVGAGLVVLMVVGCSVILLERRHSPPPDDFSPTSPEVTEIHSLREALEEQNQVLSELTSKVQTEEEKHKSKQEEADKEIARLKKEVESLKKERKTAEDKAADAQAAAAKAAAASKSSSPSSSFSLPAPIHNFGVNQDCDQRFGLGLADIIAKSKTTVCASDGSASLPSSMECYPFQQVHKSKRDRPWDMFCVAHNFFIDFSKVEGEPRTKVESHGVRAGNYHTFHKGSLTATCKKTAEYNQAQAKFMNHHRLQMESFQDQSPPPPDGSYKTVDTPTYLMARDEDCENLFHSTADHMNIYLVMEHVLKMGFQDLSVVLFDLHVDGPFYDMIQQAFSPNHKLKRTKDFNGEKVLFKTLIFHLESPAGVIFPGVWDPQPELRCHSSTFYHAYRRHILQAYDLWDVPPPPVPTVVFSVRKRTPEKNVGRVLVNSDAVEQVLSEGNMIKYQVVDMAKLSFAEQLKVMRHCNIYIGIHGAGLMHAYFLAEEAILIEIHPSYRLDRHFRIAARQSGKIYMPMRLTTPITCEGTSDNLTMDIEEFRIALDGAVRIARNFDSGVAECGLRCNPGILALDNHLDPYYGSTPKAPRLNTVFPC